MYEAIVLTGDDESRCTNFTQAGSLVDRMKHAC
jgi:hypothetical protein